MTGAEAVAYRINSLCEARGITLSQLAVKSKLSKITVMNIANGRTKNPSCLTLHKIARRGFGMTDSDFFRFPEMDTATPTYE